MLLFLSNIYSEKERLDAFFNPGKLMVSKSFIDENQDEVLKFLLLKGVAYATELSRETQLNMETINKILSVLHKKGFIKRIVPHKENPSKIVYSRIPEFWAMGLVDYYMVTRCSWWVCTLKGLEHMQGKYYGQGVQIKEALVSYLKLKVMENDS